MSIARILVVTAFAAGCAAGGRPPPAAPDPTANEPELLAATREIYQAIPVGDRAVWDRWLAPDFLLLDRDGKVMDRAAVLADFKPLPPTIQLDLAIDELTIRHLGHDAALVAFLVRETEVIFGQTLHVDYRTALTFARRGGAWTLVAFQYVELPRDAAPVPLDPARLDAYVGTYAADDVTRFVVRRDGDRLVGERPGRPAVELVPEADGVFYVPGSEFRKIFVRDAAGAVVEMLDRRKGTDVRWRRVDG